MNIEEVKTNTNNGKMWQLVDACLESGKFPRQLVDSAVAVSYTHLTLPTILLV